MCGADCLARTLAKTRLQQARESTICGVLAFLLAGVWAYLACLVGALTANVVLCALICIPALLLGGVAVLWFINPPPAAKQPARRGTGRAHGHTAALSRAGRRSDSSGARGGKPTISTPGEPERGEP